MSSFVAVLADVELLEFSLECGDQGEEFFGRGGLSLVDHSCKNKQKKREMSEKSLRLAPRWAPMFCSWSPERGPLQEQAFWVGLIASEVVRV
ncbi:hypothetical protein PIB30_088304 [Stylosanthes scabra]|uniref:Uncharacterized protein n=1 Tax=Stylosanthes scabra TaxID=79078 RepID=A0ABU6VSD1_9FABA|nr:hypothetical protein [Stylosanthes scabra]